MKYRPASFQESFFQNYVHSLTNVNLEPSQRGEIELMMFGRRGDVSSFARHSNPCVPSISGDFHFLIFCLPLSGVIRIGLPV